MNNFYAMMAHLILGVLMLVNTFTVLPVQADELTTPVFGRLFTTDKERQRIDRHRSRTFTQSGQINDMDQTEKPIVPPTVTMQGFVKRSDGKNVVWVNNENTLNNRLKQKGIRVNTRNIQGNEVDLSVAGKRVKLKPGQTLQENRDGIIEFYRHP